MLILPGHKDRVCALAYSPDGSLLASGGADGKVRLWDRATGQQRLALRGHPACVYGVAFSPGGARLASGGGRDSLWLWELPAGRGRPLSGHSVLVSGVDFSPGGKVLASAAGNVFDSHFDGEVSLWDPDTGRRLANVPVPGGAWSLAFAPDGKSLASGGGFQTVHFWDLSLGRGPALGQGTAIRCVAFAPDGRYLAVATGRAVKLWDLKAKQVVHTLRGHGDVVWSVAFSPDGRALLSGSEDRTVMVWDVACGQERASFDWRVGKVRAVAVAPDGMTAAAAGDGPVVLWDVDRW